MSIPRAARLPCPMATVAVRGEGTESPPAKTPPSAVIMVGPTSMTPSSTTTSLCLVEQGQVGVLSEGEDQRVGIKLLELASGFGEALSR